MKMNPSNRNIKDLTNFGYRTTNNNLTYANQDKNTNKIQTYISIVKMNTKTTLKHNNK
jgi:hypothetical protein